MLPERYEYTRSQSFKEYSFFSEGPKGRIQKIVSYSYLGSQDGYDYYNLGFGDYDPVAKKVSDLKVSDNKDPDKVLTTIAATAMEFTRQFPGRRIVVEGSTPSRTRLYQMKIAKHYIMISEIFDIQGLTENGTLIPFEKGKSFSAFVAELIVNL